MSSYKMTKHTCGTVTLALLMPDVVGCTDVTYDEAVKGKEVTLVIELFSVFKNILSVISHERDS